MQWARETAGLDPITAAKKLRFANRGVERLEQLESGDEEPSASVLRRMARAYHRPAVVFYLSEPPEDNFWASFRSVPVDLTPRQKGLLGAYVREVRLRQEILREALENEGTRVDWVATGRTGQSVAVVVSRLRSILDFDLHEYRRQRNVQAGFKLLREKAELGGAFVILKDNTGWRSDLTAEVFRGFSMADQVVPLVVVNPEDASNALASTLLHELTHLVLGHDGFSRTERDSALEDFCDDVAGEILLPRNDVLAACEGLEELDEEPLGIQVGQLARDWRVSGSMVAYRARRLGCITNTQAHFLFARFKALWLAARSAQMEAARRRAEQDNKPMRMNIRAKRVYRLGPSLIDTAARLWRQGVLTTTDTGKVLGIPPAGVHSFLEPWRRKP